MSCGHINKIGVAVPFKGNTKDNEKTGSSVPFIAGAAAVGAVIGAKTPERLIIKSAGDVTPENLQKLLKSLSETAKNAEKSAAKKLTNLTNKVNSALHEVQKSLTKNEKEAPLSEAASLFDPKKLGKIQEKNFNKLKDLIPKEPALHSATKGAAIAGSIAVGIVVLSKVFPDTRPSEHIYNEHYDYRMY